MRPRVVEVDKDWVYEHYTVKGMTLEKCAELLGCSICTLQSRMVEFGIERRRRGMRLGHKLTEEQCKKISESKRGDKNPAKRPEVRAKISRSQMGERNHNFGKKCSEERRRKISEAQRGERHHFYGKHPSLETRRKLSEARRGERNHFYGKKFTEEHRRRLSESRTGSKNPNFGKPRPIAARVKTSEALKGEKHPNWKGGISFEPYCDKFTDAIKEDVREEFNRRCFLCGAPENGKRLSVHHVDYNKMQGCGHLWNLIPLCSSCHGRTSVNRYYWFCLFVNHWCNKYMDFGFCGVL